MYRFARMVFAVGFCWSSLIFSLDGELDPRFGDRGRVVTDFNSRTDVGNNLLIKKNGSIILAGSAAKASVGDHLALVSYKENGALDRNFGVDGRVMTREVSPRETVHGGIMGMGQFV